MRQRTVHPLLSRKPPGFTTIEVLITLVIIAIVAVLTAPAIMEMAPNMALKSAAQDIYSSFQEAKVLAIKENRNISVIVGTDGYTIGEPFDDPIADGGDGDGLFDVGEGFTDTDGDGVYTSKKQVTFNDEYGYGIGLGTGNATADWNDASCSTVGNPCNTADATVTFNSRGIPNESDSVFLVNRDNDISYAVTVSVAGSVSTRKYDGTTPFDKDHWVE